MHGRLHALQAPLLACCDQEDLPKPAAPPRALAAALPPPPARRRPQEAPPCTGSAAWDTAAHSRVVQGQDWTGYDAALTLERLDKWIVRLINTAAQHSRRLRASLPRPARQVRHTSSGPDSRPGAFHSRAERARGRACAVLCSPFTMRPSLMLRPASTPAPALPPAAAMPATSRSALAPISSPALLVLLGRGTSAHVDASLSCLQGKRPACHGAAGGLPPASAPAGAGPGSARRGSRQRRSHHDCRFRHLPAGGPGTGPAGNAG